MIRKIKYTLFIWISLIGGVASTQSLVNTNSINVSDGTLYITGDYINQSSGNIIFNSSNSPKVKLTGDITNNAVGKIITTAGTNGTFEIAGTSTQTLDGTSTADFDFEKLTVNSGADLEIPSTKNVTVKSTLSITGDLSILSSLSSTGSLIAEGSISGTGASSVDVERYLTGSKWHVISSPVSGQAINSFITSNSIAIDATTSSYYAMTHYDETVGTWATNYTVASPPSTNMVAAKGYLAGIKNAASVSFIGTPNSGTVNIDIDSTVSGWNAIGNPFTSSIGAKSAAGTTKDFLTENSDIIDLNYQALYVLSWPTWTLISNTEGPNYLPSGQGFLIKSTGTGGTATFTASMQTHENPTFYKKAIKSSDYSQVNLFMETDSKINNTKIYFINNMTYGLDPGWDIGKYIGQEDFLIYSELVEDNGIAFDIQCLPNNDFTSMTIPIGVVFNDGGPITFSAETSELPSECQVIFEDRELGVFTDLNTINGNYTISLPASSSGTGRFFLHTFDASAVSSEVKDAENVRIFALNKNIHISGPIKGENYATLYDLTGRMIKRVLLKPGCSNVIDANNLKQGIYIISFSGNMMKQSQKVFLK